MRVFFLLVISVAIGLGIVLPLFLGIAVFFDFEIFDEKLIDQTGLLIFGSIAFTYWIWEKLY